MALARPTHDLFGRTSVVEKTIIINSSKNTQNMRRKKKDWLFDRLAYLLRETIFFSKRFPKKGKIIRDSSADSFLREDIA